MYRCCWCRKISHDSVFMLNTYAMFRSTDLIKHLFQLFSRLSFTNRVITVLCLLSTTIVKKKANRGKRGNDVSFENTPFVYFFPELFLSIRSDTLAPLAFIQQNFLFPTHFLHNANLRVRKALPKYFPKKTHTHTRAHIKHPLFSTATA